MSAQSDFPSLCTYQTCIEIGYWQVFVLRIGFLIYVQSSTMRATGDVLDNHISAQLRYFDWVRVMIPVKMWVHTMSTRVYTLLTPWHIIYEMSLWNLG